MSSANREDHYHGYPQYVRSGKVVARVLFGLGLGVSAFGIGCGLVQLRNLAQIGAQVLVQFVMSEAGQLVGTSFVAEGRLYTAKHVAEAAQLPHEDVASDLASIGDSPLQGYQICRKVHKAGDKVHVTVGPWPGVAPEYTAMLGGAMDEQPDTWVVFLSYPGLWGGVSGSPVLCDEHNAVIGCLVASLGANWIGVCRFPAEAQ